MFLWCLWLLCRFFSIKKWEVGLTNKANPYPLPPQKKNRSRTALSSTKEIKLLLPELIAVIAWTIRTIRFHFFSSLYNTVSRLFSYDTYFQDQYILSCYVVILYAFYKIYFTKQFSWSLLGVYVLCTFRQWHRDIFLSA